MSFSEKLRNKIKVFDLETAKDLSDEIHRAECNGVILSKMEEYLWLALSDKIEQAREKRKKV